MNTLARDQQVAILHMLVEGTSLRSTTRLTGTHRTTVMKLMVRAGEKLRKFLNQRMAAGLTGHLWTMEELLTEAGVLVRQPA